jgi:hypothetical protein
VYTFGTNGTFNGNVTFGEECNTATTVGSSVYGGTAFSGIKNEAGNFSNRMVLISIMPIKSVFMEKIRFWFLQEEENRFNTPIFNSKIHFIILTE